MRLAWPLTGRSEEMRTIEAAISTPDVSGIVVCGAAGVGKSRVVREVLADAAAIGSEVRWVVATASAKTLPLGAFASYAESAFTDSLQLVRGVIDTLTSASPGTPVIVSVDDAHLLDDLSAFVLHQIVQRAVAKVVVTVRAGEQVPAALQDLWKGGDFDRLDLQPLSMDETLALLTATLDGRVEPDAARRLWRLTRGNILYLRNIVEQEIGDGRFAPQQGYWQWTGDPKVPPGLAELIDTRMGSLPADVSEVVDLLAVGEPVELPSLVRMTSSVAVERAEAQGLISLDDSDGRVEVRVAHPLYGEVRRNRAPVMRLRRLRSRVADELAASDHRDDMQVVVRRATLSLDADLTPPPELFVKAAHGAAWQVDVALAERLAGAAVRAGGGADAMFIHAYLLSWLGRGRDAEALLAGATSSGDTDADRAKLVFARATNRLFGLADDVGARQLIDDAEQVVPAASRSCLDAARVVYFAATGEPRAALEASRRVVFSDLPDAAARMSAWAMTVAAGDAGRATEAVAAAEAGYPIAIRGYLVICDAHANALVLAGQIRDAEDVAAMLRQRAKDYPSPQLDPVTAGLEGRVALAGGRLDAAVSILKPIVDMLNASQETIGWTYRFSLPYFTAIAMQGFADDASAAAALEQKYHPGWRYLDYDRALALGWVAAGQGAVTEAIATVVSAAETCRANGQFAAEVMCLQTAVQFGDESCAPRLRELTSIVEGPRAAVAARFAEALIRGDGAELAAVSGDFERIGDLVAAMDAAAHAAVAHKRADRKGSALTSSVRAGELARRCGGASTPALRKASEPVPLTDREREIVMLIGQGLTSPAIAKRLTLSVRTVEGHIYRAMAKTGAADRDELGAMLPKR